jgi:hypothetical protein
MNVYVDFTAGFILTVNATYFMDTSNSALLRILLWVSIPFFCVPLPDTLPYF